VPEGGVGLIAFITGILGTGSGAGARGGSAEQTAEHAGLQQQGFVQQRWQNQPRKRSRRRGPWPQSQQLQSFLPVQS